MTEEEARWVITGVGLAAVMWMRRHDCALGLGDMSPSSKRRHVAALHMGDGCRWAVAVGLDVAAPGDGRAPMGGGGWFMGFWLIMAGIRKK